MKKMIILSISLIFVSCGKTQISINDSYLGFWLNTAYIESLKETQSTKQSQSVDLLSILNIYEEDGKVWVHRIAEFHDSGAPMELTMETENLGNIIINGKEVFASIKFNSAEKLMYSSDSNTKSFIKYEGDIEPHVIINETLFASKYLLNGNEVEFTRDGKIEGLKNYRSYKVNIDYMDAGMELDKIYFDMDGAGQRETFGYELIADTLNIFELGCAEYDSVNKMCMEITKGEVIFRLIKEPK